jgi:hypothetical protein
MRSRRTDLQRVRHRCLVVAAVAVVLPLTGCASQQEKYCDQVKQHQTELGRTADEGGPAAVLDELPVMRDLAAQAPSDIKDEWQTVISAVEALDAAFEDAGVDPDDYDPKHPPKGLSRADRVAIQDAAGDLGTKDVTDATSAVEQQALDICKTPLGL